MKNNKRILVIGSGPIVIGQAAEFDYAGTQACKSLKEEGCYVILVNSNPATIMTDVDTADKVYVEPLTIEIIEKIIIREKPDGILGTLGGQTGLNLVKDLYDKKILEKHGSPYFSSKSCTDATRTRPALLPPASLTRSSPMKRSRYEISHNLHNLVMFKSQSGTPPPLTKSN